MTLDTEQRIETTPPVETVAKPPPRAADERGHHLFQTMDGLRARHGTARTKGRILHAAAALAGGSLLFAALYALMLFLE